MGIYFNPTSANLGRTASMPPNISVSGMIRYKAALADLTTSLQMLINIATALADMSFVTALDAPNGHWLVYGGGAASTSTKLAAVGEWTTLGFTVGAGGAGVSPQKFYVNGALNGTNTLVTVITATYFGVGCGNTGGGERSNGVGSSLCDARIWSAELSPGQMAAEVASRYPMSDTNLWGYWPLDDAASAPLDRSGNGRDLTLAGGSLVTVPSFFVDDITLWNVA